MQVSADEAAKVWCQESGPAVDAPAQPFRMHCIADRCMAWTWGVRTAGDDVRRGFCGLASRG